MKRSLCTVPCIALVLCGLTATAFAADVPDDTDLPWSFAPLVRPDVDPEKYPNWALDDIDRFIAERLEAEGLRPNSGADRRTLIRRAAFDLTGLPPTLDEIESFLSDPANDQVAFARVVDDYLSRETFGERWGRHWLDIARYADSVGRTWNSPFVYAWRYRDWVIGAFNSDKPYNRFIAEQIAGDLLPADTVAKRREQVVATGFLALGSLAINMGGGEAFVLDQVDDQIDVTTRGFLGLSIACARCHDHKYDPVAQMDYYALAGVFYSSWTYSGTPHVSEHAGYGYVDPEMLVSLPTDLASPVDRVRSVPAGIHSMSDLRQFGGKAPPPFDIEPDWAMGMRDGKPVDCELREGGMVWDVGPAPPRGDIRIPGLPDFPEVPSGCQRSPATRAVDSIADPSAYRPGHGQPDLAASLRPRTGGNGRQFWSHRTRAEPSAPPRSPGRPLRRKRLVGEGIDPHDHAQPNLSAQLEPPGKRDGKGSRQCALLAFAPAPPGTRAAARQYAGGDRAS